MALDPQFGFDYGLGSVIRAIAHWIRGGLSRIASIAMLGKAYQHIPEAEKVQASHVAEQLVAMSEKFETLGPEQPLSAITGDFKLPGNETYINFKVPIIPPGEEDNPESYQWITVQWRGPWSTPANEIDAFIRETASAISEEEGCEVMVPGEVGKYVVDSLIWFQHPEQL